VLLDRNLVALVRGREALGRPMAVRVAATGRSHDDVMAAALTVTPGPTALRPLAPAHLRAQRTGDGVLLSWVRRSRIEADSWAGEVPLGEDSEAYLLAILAGSTVVRSISCTSPQALYPSAQEIADFGAPQSQLQVRVAQLSAAVGVGFATTRLLTL
jgi:hypothetical protein